jgi:ethanolamine ammonia-lyase small subunit
MDRLKLTEPVELDAAELAAPAALRRFTPARVGLGRAGSAIPTQHQLRFQLDHARARDTVHDTADFAGLLAGLRDRNLEALILESAVSATDSRSEYLRRPDLGRKLNARSTKDLQQVTEKQEPDIVFIIADGLSALAVDRHALPLLDALRATVSAETWRIAPVCIVRNGRVAVGDEIGMLLQAKLAVLLIGERPGLSAPDSLGVYLTWEPRTGRTDAERNCISNIRLEGLGYEEAARRISFYMRAARELQGTGYALKEPPSPNLSAIG